MTVKILPLLVLFSTVSFVASAQTNYDEEIQIKYLLEEQYVYYMDQNPSVTEGHVIDENGVEHRVYRSSLEIYEQVETKQFKLSDTESRTFYVFSLDVNQIKRGRTTILIDTKSGEYKTKAL
ncbi:MAG: hypothetical protein JKY53_09210 [Flavobacteriales bacterium]|nr:hypothetical protein [Flavobacteriales bacterium]